ncbi:hypothetical protein N9N67_07655 [Bacteriovoracaceae bacterium]|nr:hypothetical protein [Bacteriovoracaceae bacterium]
MRRSKYYQWTTITNLLITSCLLFSCVKNHKKKKSDKVPHVQVPAEKKKNKDTSHTQLNKKRNKDNSQLTNDINAHLLELEDELKNNAFVVFTEINKDDKNQLILKYNGNDIKSLVNARFILMKYISEGNLILSNQKETASASNTYLRLKQKVPLAQQLLKKVKLELNQIYQTDK